MTLLQVVSPLIGLITYPYVIRVLGSSNYGLYVYSLSIVSLMSILISYGFSWTGLRDIARNQNNQNEKNRVISTILISKLLLFGIVFIIFYLSTLFISFFKLNRLILFFCFLQVTIPDILFPIWFFQGIQKMKVVTFIQLFIKLLTIPLVFIFIKKSDDTHIYPMIISSCAIFGALIATWFMLFQEKIRIHLVSFNEIRANFRDSFPFFCTSIVGVAKREILPIIIGSFLSKSDVALYDLANKIVSIPTLLTEKINGALFPEIIKNPIKSRIRKIMKMEIVIGSIIILCIILGGYWLVLLMGGKQMIMAYPLACILSITVLSHLLSGSCMNLVFIPNKKYYYITQLQVVALASVIILCIPILFWQSVFIVVIAATLSGVSEVGYSFYRIKTQRLL
ncbi:MAG: oligosaccharide flippase family protein [Dysgonamonadaceae bacterium]|jgi:PST family polysaccharide transporter|nr:oligosaccharide flippase family protein [Dysgonamonadaceae bacterium]